MADTLDELVEKTLHSLQIGSVARFTYSITSTYSRSGDETHYGIEFISGYIIDGKEEFVLKTNSNYILDNNEDINSLITECIFGEIERYSKQKKLALDFGIDGNTVYVVHQDDVIYDFDAAKAIIGNDFNFEEYVEMQNQLLQQYLTSDNKGQLKSQIVSNTMKGITYFKPQEGSSRYNYFNDFLTELLDIGNEFKDPIKKIRSFLVGSNKVQEEIKQGQGDGTSKIHGPEQLNLFR